MRCIIVVLFLLIVAMFPFDIKACSFDEKFQWVKKTFEENDAWFKLTLDKNGKLLYDSHNQMIAQLIKSAKDIDESVGILRDWLMFFDNRHTNVSVINPQPSAVRVNKQLSEPYNNNTLYLRIPSFSEEHFPYIEKIANDNFSKITKTPNLIIDIRSNPYDSTEVINPLLPISYTGFFTRDIEAEILLSPLTAQNLLNNFQALLEMDVNNKSATEAFEEIKEFVKPDELIVIPNKIHEFPQNI